MIVRRILLVIALVGAALLGGHFGADMTRVAERELRDAPAPEPRVAGRPARRYDASDDGEMVEGRGVVERVLADDHEGSRHQRFILKLPSRQTLLVAHNIDVAPRIESIERGDTVEFRGQYETNDRGGVLHWTHHDPDGSRAGGWLRHEGRKYE